MTFFRTSIYELKNELNYFYDHKEFLHVLDFQILFWKLVYDTLVFEILINGLYLYLKDYYKFLLVIIVFDSIWKHYFLPFFLLNHWDSDWNSKQSWLVFKISFSLIVLLANSKLYTNLYLYVWKYISFYNL